jgi:Tol biopolymer transport system component
LVQHQTGQQLGSPTPSPNSPHLYFNRLLWSDGAGDWDGLYRVDCLSGDVERLLGRSKPGGDWLSEIVGISGDGRRLIVVNQTNTGYHLSSLDIGKRTFSPLATLPAVFA